MICIPRKKLFMRFESVITNSDDTVDNYNFEFQHNITFEYNTMDFIDDDDKKILCNEQIHYITGLNPENEEASAIQFRENLHKLYTDNMNPIMTHVHLNSDYIHFGFYIDGEHPIF